MSVTVNLKHSSTKDKAPVAADLSSTGEIALNLHPDSPALYIKDADGNIVKLAGENSASTDTDVVKKSLTSSQNMAGDLTLGTNKITLDAGSGAAVFKGGGVVGDDLSTANGLIARNNAGGSTGATIWAINKNANGHVFVGNDENVNTTSTISNDGSATFNGLTEHKGGVRVTGGSPTAVVDGVAKSSNRIVSLVADSRAVVRINPNDNYDLQLSPVVENASGTLGYGCVFSPAITDSEFTTETNVLRAQPDLNGLKTPQLNIFSATYLATNTKPTEVDNCTGFNVAPEAAVGSTQNTAFRAGFAAAGQTNFNFYASGYAPNYLRGDTYIGGTSDDLGVSTKINLLANGLGEFSGGVDVTGAASFTGQSVFTFSVSGNGAPVIEVDREGNAAGNLMVFKAAGVTAGSISLDGSGGINVNETSDYRLKENVTNIESTVDLIKNLRPVNYNYTSHPGATRQGFIAHELQQSAPLAVTGTKDATEAIGTLADYDGTVLETAVVEPEDLTYTEDVEVDGVTTQKVRTQTWTATGTQPVYQAVDQTKLIPLLTKALQEALERIEVLEAAAGGTASKKK